MAVRGYPGSRVLGQAILGYTPKPARGLTHAERLASVPNSPASAMLAWDEYGHTHITDIGRHIYLNGSLHRVVEDVTEVEVAGLRADAQNRVDVLALSLTEADSTGETPLFVAVPVGSRVKLDWSTVPTDSDFAGTAIWWDEGDGGAIDTELARVYGPEATVYVTGTLSEGSYQFGLKFFDHLGNLSSQVASVTVTVDNPPLAVTGLAASFSSATHDVTLSWAQPAGQGADVRGVWIFANYLPGPGFSDHINYSMPLTFIALATVQFVHRLFVDAIGAQESWRFGVCAVDKYGHPSEPSEATVTVEHDEVSNDLLETVDPPASVLTFDAVPLAGGEARLTWEHDDLGSVAFTIWRDGVAIDTEVDDTYDDTGLTDAQSYSYAVSAMNAGGHSPLSESIDVLADDSAPTASPTLIGELIG